MWESAFCSLFATTARDDDSNGARSQALAVRWPAPFGDNVISILGGIVGLLITLSSAETIKKLSPPEPYRFQQLTVDWNALHILFDVILLTSFLAGQRNCIEGGEPFQFVTLISINHRFPAPADFTGWQSFRKKGSTR